MKTGYLPKTMFAFLLTAALCLASFYGHAQRSNIGITFQYIGYSGSVLKTYAPGTGQSALTYKENLSGSTGMLGIEASHYRPFYKFGNEKFSIGAAGGLRPMLYIESTKGKKNFAGQTIASGSSAGNFSLQIPLLLSVAYGSCAVKGNEGFGAGLGFGVMFHTFEYGLVVGDKGSQFSPVLKLELGNQNYSINTYLVLNTYQSVYKSTLGDIPKISYTTFGISACFSFY